MYFRRVLLRWLLKINCRNESEVVRLAYQNSILLIIMMKQCVVYGWLIFGVVMLFFRCGMWFVWDCASFIRYWLLLARISSWCFLDSCQVWWWRYRAWYHAACMVFMICCGFLFGIVLACGHCVVIHIRYVCSKNRFVWSWFWVAFIRMRILSVPTLF